MLRRNIIVVFTLTLLAKGLGFLRDVAFVNQCGAGSQSDIFFAVNNVVETAICLFGIQALFGTSTKLFSEVQEDTNFRSRYFTFFTIVILIVSIPLAIAISICAKFSIDLLYPGFDENLSHTASLFLAFFVVNIPVLALLRSFNSVLGLHGNFYLQNLIPVVSNIVFISSIFLVQKDNISGALLIGITIMNIAFLIIQYFVLNRIGYSFIPPKNINRKLICCRIWELTGPLVFVTMSNSLFLMFTQYLASKCQEGTVTLLAIGGNIVFFSIGLLFASVLSVAFPTMARFYNDNKFAELNSLVIKIVDLALVIFIPISVFFVSNANIIIKGIYFRKNFSVENVSLLSEIVVVLSIAIVPMVFNLLPNHILQTYGKNRKILICALIAFITSIAATFIGYKLKGGYGIAWGLTVYHIVFAFTLWIFIDRKVVISTLNAITTKGLLWLIISLSTIQLLKKIPIETVFRNFNFSVPDVFMFPAILIFQLTSLIFVYVIIIGINKFAFRQKLAI